MNKQTGAKVVAGFQGGLLEQPVKGSVFSPQYSRKKRERGHRNCIGKPEWGYQFISLPVCLLPWDHCFDRGDSNSMPIVQRVFGTMALWGSSQALSKWCIQIAVIYKGMTWLWEMQEESCIKGWLILALTESSGVITLWCRAACIRNERHGNF